MTDIVDRRPTAEAARTLEPPRRRLLSWKLAVIAIAVVALHWYAYDASEIDLSEFFSDFGNIYTTFHKAFPPDTSWSETIHPAITGALLTFSIGLLGTTLALPFALVFAVLGSRLMTPNRVVFQVVRFLMSVLRAIPSFVFALIFVASVGLGAYPGVLALALHGIGVTAKLWWDAIDVMDTGPVEALQTTGANRVQVLQHGVFPSVLPSLVSVSIFRLDDNVRSALVLGLVGAGGIGQLIDAAINNFSFATATTDIIVMVVMIVVIDQFASVVGKRLTASR